MNNYDFYPIKCAFPDKDYFLIYCSGTKDYVESTNEFHIVFNELSGLEKYVIDQNMKPFHREECSVYNFDTTVLFDIKRKKILFHTQLMDCWNLLDDISENNSKQWSEFSRISMELRPSHEKLLFETPMFGEKGVPQQWSKTEVTELILLFNMGLDLFIKYMRNSSPNKPASRKIK